jgi:predicted MFS family arabinose efflux permease
MWAAGSFIIPIAIAGFAFSERVPISAVFIAMMGFGTIIMLNNSNAMVQSRVPDALRGRAMSLYSLMFMAGAPMGSLLVGSLAEVTSAQATALVCATGLLIFAAVIWFLRPDVRLMK